MGADRAHAFDRGRVYRFHRFRKQLAQHAACIEGDGQHPRQRAKPHGQHKQGADHQIRNRAQGVQQAAHGLLDIDGRHIARGQKPKGRGEQHRQERAPQRHLQGQEHILGIVAPVIEIGMTHPRQEVLHIGRVRKQHAHIAQMHGGRRKGEGHDDGEQKPKVDQPLAQRLYRRLQRHGAFFCEASAAVFIWRMGSR